MYQIFPTRFNKLDKTWARMLDPLYKILKAWIALYLFIMSSDTFRNHMYWICKISLRYTSMKVNICRHD